MNFYAIPDPPRGVSVEQVSNLYRLLSPSELAAYAGPQDYYERSGYSLQPPVEGPAKYWRLNSAIWWPNKQQHIIVTLDRNPDGSVASIDLQDTGSGRGFSDWTFNVLSHGAGNFYRSRADRFRRIPKLTYRILDGSEARRFSLPLSPAVTPDYPLGTFLQDPYGPLRIITEDESTGDVIPPRLVPSRGVDQGNLRCTLRSDIALRFNEHGKPEFFFFEEYIREVK